MDENQLLRKSVVDDFRVLECSILIELNHNFKTATYTYEYEIVKQRECEDIWREVFAYPKSDFDITYVRSGKDNGLKYDVISLDTPTRNACLKICFDTLTVGEKTSFSYKCTTRIESISNMTKFGGNGVAWYWIAHEFPCDLMQITFKIPHNLTIKDTHPQATKSEENKAVFVNKSLLSNEFAPALVTYEKNVLGLSPKQSRYLETIFNLFIGALISFGLSLLFL